MDYYCKVCNMVIKPKSKSRHFKSYNHKKLDRHKHVKITINNPNMDNIDKIFYIHINEYDNEYENYLVRCEFILCLINLIEYGLLRVN